MNTTPHLYRLSRLNEPSNFLRGGHLPLGEGEGIRAHWANDTLVQWRQDSLGTAWPCVRFISDPGEVFGAFYGLDVFPWAGLDLRDRSVASWCDQKIAEHQHGRHVPELSSSLVVHTDDQGQRHFALAALDLQGRSYLSHVAAFPRGGATAGEGIPCNELHIPAVRAALLDALFGAR